LDAVMHNLPAGGSTVRVQERRDITIDLPAAQKDRSAELQTRASALRPVQAAGIVLILASVACFTPWLRPFVGSTTTPILGLACGLGLVILSSILQRDFPLWLLLIALVPAAYWFIHRHARATAPGTNRLTNPQA
jgi:hypothetical protein